MGSSSILCWFSAIVYMISNALTIVLYTRQKNSFTSYNRDRYEELSPFVLTNLWIDRYEDRGIFYAAGFLNSFFWIIFCIPLIEMAWILSRNGTRALALNAGIVVLAIAAAIGEWLSHLFWVGMNSASFVLTNNFNLDIWLRPDVVAATNTTDPFAGEGMGWRDLEVNHIVGTGMIWIIDSFEWLCLAGIFIFTFFSVFQWRKDEQTSFGPRWNALGLFIGLLSFVEFALEILRYKGFKSAEVVTILYAALDRLILIPAWIISLGFQLPRATAKHFESYDVNQFMADGELALTEMQSLQDANANNFTIDGDDNERQPPAPTPPPTRRPAGPASPPAQAFAPQPLSPPSEAFAPQPLSPPAEAFAANPMVV